MSKKPKRAKKSQPPSSASTTEDTRLDDDGQTKTDRTPPKNLLPPYLPSWADICNSLGADVSAEDAHGSGPDLMEDIDNGWTDEQLLDLIRCWVGHLLRKEPEDVADEEVRLGGFRLASGLPSLCWPSEFRDFEDNEGQLDAAIAAQILRVINGLEQSGPPAVSEPSPDGQTGA